MLFRPWRLPAWFWIWLILAAAMMLARPALPIDETRYLAVAWEMWWRGSFAVPYLNGEFYDGKPPLFFWLMHAGWAVLGVNEWWARAIAPLFGLGGLVMVRAIARQLWGDHPAAEAAPTILLGCLWWTVFCASTMFDMVLGFFVLLSLYAVLRVWRGGGRSNFALAGLALGLGILAKGPVVFLPVLFVVLAAPWWMAAGPPPGFSWRAWYGGALYAAAIAAGVAGLWLAPMFHASDLDYLMNMTFHQTGGYVAESFSHRRPVWWYLPLLPVLLFPWTAWPRAWRALAAGTGQADAGVRLCTAWAVGVVVVMSLISGKQAHYLLTMFPAVALLLARLLPAIDRGRDRSLLVPAGMLAGLGALALAWAGGLVTLSGATWFGPVPREIVCGMGAVLVIIGGAVVCARGAALQARVTTLTAAGCAAVLVLTWGLFRASSPAYDVRPVSRYLSQLDHEIASFAMTQGYHGQFNFYGRIKGRVDEVSPAGAVNWAHIHPDGYLIGFHSRSTWSEAGPAPIYDVVYRGGRLAIWRAQDLIQHPYIAKTFE